jgi:hypothetical protein
MKTRPIHTLFVFGDGDRIRDRIENLLFNDDLSGLSSLSRSLSEGISRLADQSAHRMQAHVIMAGGDDLLLQIPLPSFDVDVLSQLGGEYLAITGSSASFGVGHTIVEAYVNLRRAKVKGGGRIVGPGEPS